MKKHASSFRRDFIILSLLIVFTFLFFEAFEVTEWLYEFSRQHESLQIDEVLLTISTSFFYISIFAIRRYRELAVAQHDSITDPLVDTLNRRGGLELLENNHREKRTTKHGNSLILFDIDNFKQVNDQHGHNIGDDVLLAIADISKQTLRGSDSLIRWGGEEFLIVCENTPLDKAIQLSERLRRNIETQAFNPVEKVTASFGVARFDTNKPIKESIKRADDCLYESKKHGKNRVTSESSMLTDPVI